MYYNVFYDIYEFEKSFSRENAVYVKRVCHILFVVVVFSVYYSLLQDTFHFSEIKFAIYF